ncbi:tyrosine-type recombinase/integrase [Caryophanon tenue]|uniref:Tyr recombinase domain-containing protein n=1 Tax=Caryophanon tenue TaxID=33978 RepID=A0A1C0YKV9_9BACL|nr:tyrosine-type recombinase/integrase [Caryophanon tenue]OCS87817.1 hypothetical protein A6M13_10995 [Caryophanon tenue]
MDWINSEKLNAELKKHLKIENEEVKQAILQLQKTSANDWLNSPKQLNRYNVYYVLTWAIKTKLFSDENYKKMILKKIIDCPGIRGNRILDILIYFGYFTQEQVNKIKSEHYSLILHSAKFFYLHFVYINKPFGEITISDMQSYFNDFDEYHMAQHNLKRLKKILYSFGYFNKRSTKNVKKFNLELLSANHTFGHIIQDYNTFLIAGGAKKTYRKLSFTSLKNFIDFIEINNINSEELCNEHLDKFIDYCKENKNYLASTILTYIPKIQNFLDWGVGSYSSLPKQKVKFSKSKMTMLRSEAKRHREESDGFAFEKEEYPLMISSILKSFKPKNEEEFLAYNYWRIISSCPVRSAFVLSLEFDNCMYPMLNEKDVLCLYSTDSDKAGNKNGQFPILDPMGIEAVRELEENIKENRDCYKPLFNTDSERMFIHLFQYTSTNKILSINEINNFSEKYFKTEIAKSLNMDKSEVKFSSHSFRHYLLTHIVRKTGSEEAAQAAAGHHDGKMVRKAYIKSKHAKNALLYRVLDKYEAGDITGKFYLKIIAKLTETTEFDSATMKDLEKNIEFEEYIKKHGRKTAMGYCFEEEQSCNHYLKCWNCPFFMMKREEIEGAVELLAKLIMEFKDIQQHSKNFNIHSTIAQNKLRAIALIKERLSDLKYSDEQIEELVLKHFKEEIWD